MAEDSARAIDRACAALGLRPAPAQRAALAGYLELLARWNATYNLTAVRERDAMVTQHLADCLAVVAPLARHRKTGRLLDVGSGGGLPGVVLAVMLPRWDVTCIDAVAKKAAFVRQVAGALRLPNLHARHGRVEAAGSGDEGAGGGGAAGDLFDVVTARAFASLAELVRLTESRLAADGVWMAMKGRAPTDEIAALPAEIEVFHVEPLAVPGLDAERCLVWMRRRA